MAKKLLVIVDYQNDFVTGSLGFPKAATLEDGIYNKAKQYLDNGDVVLFTFDTHFDDYLNTREGKHLPIIHTKMYTEGHKLYGKLQEFNNTQDNVIFVNKLSFGIDPYLMFNLGHVIEEKVESKKNLELVEFVGIVTDKCVISNVVTFQSLLYNTPMRVDASLCASFDDSLHEKALDVIESLQVEVIGR